ncbi:MAG: NAD(P)/FAD-dependent oxidoreductase [Bacteroidota bacterium]
MDLHSGLPFSLIHHGLPFQYPKLAKSIQADVVIIGGGISGALTAHYLTLAGIECILVDGRTIGLGSTCASTSLLQYEIDVSLADLITLRGKRHAVRAYHLCREAIEKLAQVSKRVGVPDFEFCQSLYFAAFKKDAGFLQQEYELRKSMGLCVMLLGQGDIEKRFGFSAPSAILSDHGAHVDAYILTHLLLQHGIKNGLKVFDRTFIGKVVRHRRSVTLKTSDGFSLQAKKLINATGYEVTTFLKKKIVKLHSTYATISEHMPEYHDLWNSRTLFWNTAKPYLYFRKSEDGRILIGGRDEDFFNPTRRDKLIAAKAKHLAKDFNKLFPATVFKPEFSWTGTFGSTPDGLPFIGAYPSNAHTYYALGFGGNGITFSLIAAEILTNILLGKRCKDVALFSFDRV